MNDLAEITGHIERGMIPAHLYSDPALFELEREAIFGRAWVFVAHESEIPAPGDYVVRRIVDDSFIVVRDREGDIRVHFNMCIHRGMQVCRAEQGNASHFRCPYHGWSYRNDGSLAGLPFHEDAYGGEAGFPRAGNGLLSPARVDSINGLIFVNLDAEAPPLREYIGDFTYYLDFYSRQSRSGLELRGPQRWRVRANWKIGCENFVGDMYHTPYTHQSVVDISLFREPKAHKRKEGAVYFAGKGGGTTYKLPAGDLGERLRYVGYPDEMIERMREVWTAEQARLVVGSGFMVSAATLFPNLSLVHNWPQVDGTEEVTPFISIRQWQPVSSTETEVLSWFAVDREAPNDFKRRSYKAYLMCFGSSGMYEQDDVENWVSITDVSRGTMARRLLLNSRMGLTADDRPLTQPLADFAGPGVARVGYGEHNQRSWLGLWSQHLTGAMAMADREPERALPYDDPRHLSAAHFLVEEAALLDGRHWHEWLELLADDIRYVMPVRVTVGRRGAAAASERGGMDHFDEDRHSLGKRVERLTTEHAWTEDPPSRTRHLVTNIRTFATASADELRVESALLLFRSRGDTRPPEIVCAGRVDRLRRNGADYVLAERLIEVDESVLRTQNLAIFL